jgi:hypoxanthine phosphoribosyltransferase
VNNPRQGIPCELVTWDQVQGLARDLSYRIREDAYDPDIIIALGRGGWVPGRLLSDYLGKLNLTEFKVEHYTGTRKKSVARVRYPLNADVSNQRVLVVDDVTDTGDSYQIAMDHIRSRGTPREIRTVALHHKEVSPYVPDYFGRRVIEWRWIIYPWAIVEDLTALIDGLTDRPASAEAMVERLSEAHGIDVPAATIRDVLALMPG